MYIQNLLYSAHSMLLCRPCINMYEYLVNKDMHIYIYIHMCYVYICIEMFTYRCIHLFFTFHALGHRHWPPRSPLPEEVGSCWDMQQSNACTILHPIPFHKRDVCSQSQNTYKHGFNLTELSRCKQLSSIIGRSWTLAMTWFSSSRSSNFLDVLSFEFGIQHV